MAAPEQALSWEAEVPLVTNPLILRAWFKAMGATFLLAMLILGSVFVGTGQIAQVPMLAAVFAAAVLGLTLLGLLIMAVVFGNRLRARFVVSAQGVSYESLDNRAKSLVRLAIAAGALTGQPGATGAGLLAASREKVALPWRAVSAVRRVPQRHTIVLRNDWRDLLHLYCLPENYTAVGHFVEQRIGTAASGEHRSPGRSPLPGALLGTALVVSASLPLFALGEVTGLDLFVPLLAMLFSLATVWLIPLFGWVVLPLLAYILVHTALALVQLREFTLISTYRYRVYESLDSGEIAVLLATFAGLSYLGWTAWRAVRGRLVPLLMRDQAGIDR